MNNRKIGRMNKLLNNLSLLTVASIGTTLAGVWTPNYAETLNHQANLDKQLLDQISEYNQEFLQDELNQVTNVNQLRDISPKDWAYEALKSLVERYGCIVGYPDSSFRGNRALSRYEFAAGLNACLQQMERLIAENVAVLREDIEKLQRLMQEFAGELAAFGSRIDNLESRVAFLEDHQFSTTTKLLGTAVFAVNDVWGGDGDRNQTVLQDRITLNLATSFSGKDLLLLNLSAGNVPVSVNGSAWELPGTEAGGVTVSTAEGTLSSQFAANTNNSLQLLFASYQFPAGDRLRFTINSGFGVFHTFAPTLNPYLDDLDGGRGAISVFGQRNPIYSIGGGTGIGANYQITDQFLLTASYKAATEPFARYGVGCMMPEDNSSFRNLVNQAIARTLQGYLNGDSKYTAMVNKWIGPQGIVELPTELIKAYFQSVLFSYEEIPLTGVPAPSK